MVLARPKQRKDAIINIYNYIKYIEFKNLFNYSVSKLCPTMFYNIL